MSILSKIIHKTQTEIRPLNLEADAYERIFRESPPSHLGIALVNLVDNKLEVEAKMAAIIRLGVARSVLTELCDYPEFRREFLPSGVNRTTFKATSCEIPPEFQFEVGGARFQWCSNGTVIQVAFFNGDVRIKSESCGDMAMAMSYLDEWILRTESLEPADHKPLAVDPNLAASYAQNIGKLFRNGAGIWSEGLVQFRNFLMVAARAAIDEEPIIRQMREFASSGRRSYLDS